MQERTFRSPNFFDQEIDLSQRVAEPIGVPAGVIGKSDRGPAFVPVTVGSVADLTTKFGNVSTYLHGMQTAKRFMENKSAMTYLRVLGAGANSTGAEIETTRQEGRTANAGFFLTGSTGNGKLGTVQYIVANHSASLNSDFGMPIFTDNDSFDNVWSTINLVRGVVFMAGDSRLQIAGGDDGAIPVAGVADDLGAIGTAGDVMNNRFKLIISSSDTTFGGSENRQGLLVMTASLDPDDQYYISKILNTDPSEFSARKHLLYMDLAVDNGVAAVSTNVAIVSGTLSSSATSGDTSMTFIDAFGRFDSRYTTPKTSMIITQPFGSKEYDLFKFESLNDGEYGNTDVKISVVNVRASTDPSMKYGTFGIQVRKYDDTDSNPQVLEFYTNLSINPSDDNYVLRAIGDKKAYFNFDAQSDDERRMVVSGKYANKSKYVRILPSNDLENKRVPENALPFGFRGSSCLKMTDSLNDYSLLTRRLHGLGTLNSLTGSIVPPIPLRFKVTRGDVSETPLYVGDVGNNEVVDGRFYWGVKFERNDDPLNSNVSTERNKFIDSIVKFQGIEKLDVLVTGSATDTFNNNKFTLARVALSASATATVSDRPVTDQMKEAAYMRNGVVDPVTYEITDSLSGGSRVTFASLLNLDQDEFNRFTKYAKFTTFLAGGFDGLNILDIDSFRMNDRGTSTNQNSTDSVDGCALSSYVPAGFNVIQNGSDKDNNAVFAYRTAARIMTDPMTTRINLLAIPDVRDSLVTDYASDLARDNGMVLYIMDIETFDNDGQRIFIGTDAEDHPSVDLTVSSFSARPIDNSYVSTYFPDVYIKDTGLNRTVFAPASTAAMAAIGYNDKVGYPWFAPAGFNRGSLDFVVNTTTRLNSNDRDVLYDARINPIATFPRQGFVIFGQKTTKVSRSALDRVNVRRMMLEIKRVIVGVADRFVFEHNTPQTRKRFVNEVIPYLSAVQTQAGIEGFNVVMDDTNNSQLDIESNRLNGKIVVIPTRTIEFISIDFIITNAGVQFTN